MAVETETERAVFFETDDFAVAATYTRAGEGSPDPDVNGIFDNEFVSVSLQGEMEIASTDPVFECSTASLPAGYGVGDTLVINAITFKARIFKPDGTGVMQIVLEKQ